MIILDAGSLFLKGLKVVDGRLEKRRNIISFAVNKLVNAALDGGGKDNITVIVIGC